ncbi:MAG: hypothetical protein Q4B71_00290 [Cardiobacteriaceae bacterium]|nr:hypothetical protein [Cardiobacteriaceae bacterium]
MGQILPLGLVSSKSRKSSKTNRILELGLQTRKNPRGLRAPKNQLLPLHLERRDIYCSGAGYFAGMGDGLVTVAGRVASRPVWVISPRYRKVVAATWSRPDGRYYLGGLNPHERYLVMVRDHHADYAPYAWDNLTPASDLSPLEQSAFAAELGLTRP